MLMSSNSPLVVIDVPPMISNPVPEVRPVNDILDPSPVVRELATTLIRPSAEPVPVYVPVPVMVNPAPTVLAPRTRSISSPPVCIVAPEPVIL